MICKHTSSFLWIFFVLLSCQINPKQSETTTSKNAEPTATADSSQAAPIPDEAANTPAEEAQAVTPAQRIKPGISIGQTTLNMKAEAVNQVLGKGDRSDAAMGKAWSVWYSKPNSSDTARHETTIYFVTNMGGPDEASRVKQIRVTSSFFKTTANLGVGMKLAVIQKAFPNLKAVQTYTSSKIKQSVTILDDTAAGIAFEINPQNTCVAVAVHEPQQPVNTTYINLFP